MKTTEKIARTRELARHVPGCAGAEVRITTTHEAAGDEPFAYGVAVLKEPDFSVLVYANDVDLERALDDVLGRVEAIAEVQIRSQIDEGKRRVADLKKVLDSIRAGAPAQD